MATFHQYLAKL